MDDPISACDQKVGADIMRSLVTFSKERNGLGKEKCVVVACHQLNLLKYFDRILVMDKGQIVEEGEYESLASDEGSIFYELLSAYNETKTTETKKKVSKIDQKPKKSPEKFSNSEKSTGEKSKLIAIKSNDSDSEGSKNAESDILKTDNNESIGWQIYKTYATLLIGCSAILIIIVFECLCQFLFFSTSWWIKEFSNFENYKNLNQTYQQILYFDNQTNQNGENNNSLSYTDYIYSSIQFYAYLVLFLFVVTITYRLSLILWHLKTHSKLHQNLLKNMIKAPMTLFETPGFSSKLTNVFMRDMGVVDNEIPMAALFTLLLCVRAIFCLMTAVLANKYMIFGSLIILYLYAFLREYSMKAARFFRRMEGFSKAPVYNAISDTIDGAVPIRIYQIEDFFKNKFNQAHDKHTLFYSIMLYLNMHLGFYLDAISILYNGFVIWTIAIVNFFYPHYFTSDMAGFVIAAGVGLNGALQWGVKNSTLLEQAMISVERISEFANVEGEEQLEKNVNANVNALPKIKPTLDKSQPLSIKFDNATLCYGKSNTLAAFSKITFEIKSGEKIGIVGRTGAGKSSILYALFRLKDIEDHGQISLFGVDTKDMALKDLRSEIAYIPQNPFLFEGTLLDNLDPRNQFEKDEIEAIVKLVGIDKSLILSTATKETVLTHKINENGNNLSAGQKQLICLCRALLQKTKILAIDEATANVDHKTDSELQKALRHKKFDDTTILTIAHRIDTIMDYDRIMVMDDGRLVGFDSYKNLMKDCEIFRQLQ